MKSNNNNNNDDDDDDDDDYDDDNNNNTAMGSVHARGDTFLTFGLKALTETNTSRLATGLYICGTTLLEWVKVRVMIEPRNRSSPILIYHLQPFIFEVTVLNKQMGWMVRTIAVDALQTA
jgi:hypothetical protein